MDATVSSQNVASSYNWKSLKHGRQYESLHTQLIPTHSQYQTTRVAYDSEDSFTALVPCQYKIRIKILALSFKAASGLDTGTLHLPLSNNASRLQSSSRAMKLIVPRGKLPQAGSWEIPEADTKAGESLFQKTG